MILKRCLKNDEGDLVLIDFKLSDNLKTNMILFCNVLRRIGLTIGPSGTVDALKALNYSYKTLRRDFFWVLASILVKNKDDMSTFERIFEIFWISQPKLKEIAKKQQSENLYEETGREEDNNSADI